MIRRSKKVKDADNNLSYKHLFLVNGVLPTIDAPFDETDKEIADNLIYDLANCAIINFPDMEDFSNEANKEKLVKKFLEEKGYINETNYRQALMMYAVIQALNNNGQELANKFYEIAHGADKVFEEETKRDPNAPKQGPWDDSAKKVRSYVFKFKDGTTIKCHSAESKDAVKKEAMAVYKQMKDEEFEGEFTEIETPVETTELVEVEPSTEIEGIYDVVDTQNVVGMKTDSDDLIYIPNGKVICRNFRQIMETGVISYQKEVAIAGLLASVAGKNMMNLDDVTWLSIIVQDVCTTAGLEMKFASDQEREMVEQASLNAERQRARVERENRTLIGQDSKKIKGKDWFTPYAYEITNEELQKNYVALIYPCKNETWDYEMLNAQSAVDDYSNEDKIVIMPFIVKSDENNTICGAIQVIDPNKEYTTIGEFNSINDAKEAVKEEYEYLINKPKAL